MIRLLSLLLLIPLVGFLAFDVGEWVLKYRNTKPGQLPFQVYVPQQIVGRPDLKQNNVLIVGSSSTREFFGHEEDLNQFLSAQCGKPVRGFNASTSLQAFSGSLAVIDLYKEYVGDPDLIIIGLTARRITSPDFDFSERFDLVKLALPPSQNAFAWYEWPFSVLSSITGKVQQFGKLPTLLRPASSLNLDGVHTPTVRYIYDEQPPPDLARKISNAIAWRETFVTGGPDQTARNAKWTKAAFTRSAGNTPVIFVLTPVAPFSAAFSYPDADSPSLTAALTELSEIGPIYDLRNADKLGLTNENFWDEQHLLKNGRVHMLSISPLPFADGLCGAIND